MPKAIELTVEIDVQKVSCPGVWLCQDGRVSLTVFALGTSYQTCLLPPTFPLLFKDVFYFRKRFMESCALNNICCLLKEETIYCELVQWTDDCQTGTCTILAQYLGSLNDLLFPSNVCSSDGVDLLMRRSPEFPGILSPKIEISTKVRIDEIWNSLNNNYGTKPCHCNLEGSRQKQVCHSAQYHRFNCPSAVRKLNSPWSRSQSRTRARSVGSRSYCSLSQKDTNLNCSCPSSIHNSRSPYPTRRRRHYDVYTVNTPNNQWLDACNSSCDDERADEDPLQPEDQERLQRTLLESRYIEQQHPLDNKSRIKTHEIHKSVAPCICEICKKYHEMFHTGNTAS